MLPSTQSGPAVPKVLSSSPPPSTDQVAPKKARTSIDAEVVDDAAFKSAIDKWALFIDRTKRARPQSAHEVRTKGLQRAVELWTPLVSDTSGSVAKFLCGSLAR